ncbi:MAG: hypothetical protein BGO67_01090 [Alphaproteobacteria bacterium 41-28]|nr:MAG: hypothetical protein BGO67_01090 [Alphaproteobacteria bacterium 41-28]
MILLICQFFHKILELTSSVKFTQIMVYETNLKSLREYLHCWRVWHTDLPSQVHSVEDIISSLVESVIILRKWEFSEITKSATYSLSLIGLITLGKEN